MLRGSDQNGPWERNGNRHVQRWRLCFLQTPAFTLIELLVVVVIIAIVAAMLLPALSKAKAQAQSTACKNHLHQMGIALRMYLDDFHAYPAYESPAPQTGQPQNWSYSFWPYYRLAWTNASFHCPAYKGIIGENTMTGIGWGSYGYNAYGVSFSPQNPYGLDAPLLGPSMGGPRGPAISESTVLVPSEMFAITDARAFYEADSGWTGLNWTYCCPSVLSLKELQQPPQHGNGFNGVYCDGHVSLLKVKDLFNPTNTAQNWNRDHQLHKENWL